MTDKFDILIFIKQKLAEEGEEEVTWSILLKHFVDEAPPYRRISKRTLHLWLLELIKEGYVEKVINKKTLRPCYVFTYAGYEEATKHEIEREWIEEVKKVTEKTLLRSLEKVRRGIAFFSTQAGFLYETYKKILQDIFDLTETEFEALYNLYSHRKQKEDESKFSNREEGFYFWLKNRGYENLEFKDLALDEFYNEEDAKKDLEIFKKVIERKKKTA